MRRHWKRLAKRASNAACDDQERTQALAGALQHDWNHEIPPGLPGRLRDILDDRQGDLLGDSAPERLEVLRGETADSPLASILVDCAAQALHEGYSGDDAVVKATADTLQERACSSRRQVEEHWLRESSVRSATLMRSRIDAAIAAADVIAIARDCLGVGNGASLQAPRRKTGISGAIPRYRQDGDLRVLALRSRRLL